MAEDSQHFLFEQLQTIASEKAQKDLLGTWFKGSRTYLDAFTDEVLEVEAELDLNRPCFLEDELGDLLWVIACLLEHLELEGKIHKKQVISRAFVKYSERVTHRSPIETWDDVKLRQKLRLEQEHAQFSMTKHIDKC